LEQIKALESLRDAVFHHPQEQVHVRVIRAVDRIVESDEGKDEILQGDIDARQNGISGVPFFIFNRRIGVSGAHEAETLLKAMLDSTKD
jgi:predicted DsbA family dithiol-disulfide isomerase